MNYQVRYDPNALTIKAYSDDSQSDAEYIARDCLQKGYSNGWCGSIEQRAAVAVILKPLNIVYSDDMWGEWSTKKVR